MNEQERKEVLKAARKDNFVFSTTDVGNALWLLEEITKATKTYTVTEPKVTRCPKGDMRLFPKEFKELNLKQETISDPELNLETEAEDCAESTGLLISGNDGTGNPFNLLTRGSSIAGINDAARSSGRGLSDLYQQNLDFYIGCVNYLLWGRRHTPLTFIEVMGRVTSVVSSSYKHLNQDELLQFFLVAAAQNSGKLTNFNYSHELTYATVTFPSEKVETYSVDQLGFDPKTSSMQMHMKNSVTRNSAARVFFSIKDGDKELVAIGAYTAHFGNADVSKFSEACLGMNEALNQSIAELMALTKIQLTHAESSCREVAHRVGISDRRIVEEIKAAKRSGIDFDTLSAYEAYLFLNRVIDNGPIAKSKTKGFSGNTELIDTYIRTETKAKVANQQWQEIDKVLYYDDVDASVPSDVDPRQISLLDEEVVV